MKQIIMENVLNVIVVIILLTMIHQRGVIMIVLHVGLENIVLVIKRIVMIVKQGIIPAQEVRHVLSVQQIHILTHPDRLRVKVVILHVKRRQVVDRLVITQAVSVIDVLMDIITQEKHVQPVQRVLIITHQVKFIHLHHVQIVLIIIIRMQRVKHHANHVM